MDGQISRDEWQRNDVFDQLDTNKDGLLSRDELSARAGRMGGQMGGRMDRDHNRQISASEWKGTPEDFKRLDINGDGILTKDELKVRRRTR
jgi:Ca2+-binding EF-hand superfamily protein